MNLSRLIFLAGIFAVHVASAEDAASTAATNTASIAMSSAASYGERYAASPREFAHPIEHFRKISESPAIYRRAMTQVGESLVSKRAFQAAGEVWLEVLIASSDYDARFAAAQKWNEAVRRSSATMRDQLRYVEQAVAMAQEIRFRRSDLKLSRKDAARLAYLEVSTRDTVTRMQQSVRDNGDRDSFAAVVRGYELYQVGFPQQSSTSKVQANRAESLFRAQEWSRAGIEFEELSRNEKVGQKRLEYRESAIQAYVKALNDSDKATPLTLLRARRGVREVGVSWLESNLRHPAAASTAYNIGQSWYEDRAFPEAIKAFGFFVEKFAHDRRSRDAIFMIINSYSQKEDFKGLIRVSKRLEKLPMLSIEDRKSIRELMQRAQLKNVQTIAGVFGTKEYAANLLDLASKHKGSLGATALYEAFTSMHSKQESGMFDVGESLVEQFPTSNYTKGVLASMLKAALQTVDFERAARYMAIYSSRYPSDPESATLRKNAALILEWLGDFQEASRLYRNDGDVESVARCDYLAGEWARLEGSATKIEPHQGLYYYTLALWRQGRHANALPRLKQLAGRADPEHSSFARFLIAQRALDEFREIRMRDSADQTALVNKVKAFQSLSKELGEIARVGAGRWAIAALYLLGQTNMELGRFIATSPIPSGLKPSEVKTYKRELAKQVKQYKIASNEKFKQCLETAERFEVFTKYATGCRSKGKLDVKEETDSFTAAKSTANKAGRLEKTETSVFEEADRLRRKLYDSPRDTNTMIGLGTVYMRAGQYWTAAAIFNRALELDKKNAEAMAGIGVSRLYLGDAEEAARMFKRALSLDPNEPTAIWNLSGLYREFGFKSLLKSLAEKRVRVSKPILLHPIASKL